MPLVEPWPRGPNKSRAAAVLLLALLALTVAVVVVLTAPLR
jgi:hypothetical protein